MTALPNKDLVDMNIAIVAEKLMRNGIDPNSLKNANQVENAIRMIESRPKTGGVTSAKSAKIFDMEGKEIPKGSKIMGGKAIDDLPPPGSRGGPDDIAAPVMDVEDMGEGFIDFVRKTDPEGAAKLQKAEDEIRAKIEAANKRAIENLKKKKKKKDDDPEDMAQGGRAGFKDGLTPSFEEYMRERQGMEQKRNLEQMYKEYLEDMRRKKVMEQKQMVAEGGRIGFKDGMTRRTFLKILGGAMSIPIIGKFLKPMKVGKTVTKVPMIKTDDVAGKPEWFDALVNNVIMEGDDVTKRFSSGERQIIHQKDLGDGTTVRVTQDTDQGAVRVEYESEQNVFGDPVQMEYKKPLPDEGDPRPSAEFTTAESGPVGRQSGPDDYDIEIDEVGGSSIRDLDSDVSKLKEYATGKGPTIKEIIQNKKRRDKAQRITDDPEAQTDAVIARQGEMLDVDPEPDFALGGIARLLGE